MCWPFVVNSTIWKTLRPASHVGSVDRDGTNYNTSSLSISSTSLFWAAVWRSLSQWNSKTWKPGIGPLELHGTPWNSKIPSASKFSCKSKAIGFFCWKWATSSVNFRQGPRLESTRWDAVVIIARVWNVRLSHEKLRFQVQDGPGPWRLSFTMSIPMPGHDQNFTHQIHSFGFVLSWSESCVRFWVGMTLWRIMTHVTCGCCMLLPGEFPEGHWGEAGGAAPHLREGTHGKSKTPGGCHEQRREHGAFHECRWC